MGKMMYSCSIIFAGKFLRIIFFVQMSLLMTTNWRIWVRNTGRQYSCWKTGSYLCDIQHPTPPFSHPVFVVLE
jgi:hypothetical protein